MEFPLKRKKILNSFYTMALKGQIPFFFSVLNFLFLEQYIYCFKKRKENFWYFFHFLFNKTEREICRTYISTFFCFKKRIFQQNAVNTLLYPGFLPLPSSSYLVIIFLTTRLSLCLPMLKWLFIQINSFSACFFHCFLTRAECYTREHGSRRS